LLLASRWSEIEDAKTWRSAFDWGAIEIFLSRDRQN
jgi:hypothetical protein